LPNTARYTYPISKEKSAKIQASAFRNNNNLLKPIEGIEYEKLSFINESRVNNVKEFLKQFKSYNEFKLYIDGLLNDLSFGIDSKKFEKAMQDVGELLGYISQRPDQEIRKGPDNLWCGEGDQYLLFECKNEVSESRGAITKVEAGQMNNHCGWFDSKYGKHVTVSNFMIIPTKDLVYEADFTHEVKIIRRNGLKRFKDNIRGFVSELDKYEWNTISSESLQKYLDLHKLNMDSFEKEYSEDYYHRQSKNIDKEVER